MPDQPIVTAIEYARDGLVSSITYGDDAGGTRTPTVSTTTYDIRRRPVRFRTRREATGMTAGELAAVTVPVDSLYRVVGAEFDCTQTDGRRTPEDEETDWRTHARGFAATYEHDPMR